MRKILILTPTETDKHLALSLLGIQGEFDHNGTFRVNTFQDWSWRLMSSYPQSSRVHDVIPGGDAYYDNLADLLENSNFRDIVRASYSEILYYGDIDDDESPLWIILAQLNQIVEVRPFGDRFRETIG